ncbi:hypothetical protein G6F57_004550 [Rhizopus arrhizus]|uniref:EF-hand domain-containing protein n=1 Tax=Rhizopus oryzae TaxID=64495 RepID=A0A9P6XCN0_RHIOR|nr:hypothetical protein G6F23_000574 [Rhizopus arrhizus]KAG1421831.1 hypothetical protein G6F58_003580 [Rhizopus delemar]KAG0766363.1 hypothetical protein G6F24_003674 [Rhizopus arrhizus]KAG0792457.1 hypothetical protein G6F21_004339 [Rhizopus arrhizus]KAG0802556.1 hypothetical protein G6F22_000141 [Rhizopus arrhizus]
MPKDISKRNSIDSLSYCIIEMQKQKDLRLSPMKDTRPVDQSSVSAKVTVENPFGDIQQDTLNITYNEMKGEGKQDKYIENNFKVSSCLTEDEDSDCEFDWNDDPDHIKLKRRKTTKERLQAAIRNPCCWHYLSPLLKRVIIAFLGSCIFVIIAIIIYFALPKPTQAERQNPDFKNIRNSVPSIVSLWIKIFRGRRSERAKSYMEYYMSLKGYFCIILLAAWNVGSWTFLINIPFPSIKLHSYSSVITKAFRCLLAAAILLFGQKAITEVIALKFHRTAFQDRLVENKKSLKILDTLSKSEKRIRPVSSSVVTNRNSRVRNRRSQKGLKDQQNIDVCREPVKLTDKAIHHLSSFDIFKKGISSIVLAEKPTSDVSGRLEKDKMDINSDDSAKKVAKKLFYSLAFPDGNFLGKDEDIKSKLDIRHFTPYFGKPEEAKEAFDVFDKDGNGNLTRREFRDTVVQIYRERKGLAQAIRDTSQAMGKIDGILLVITCLITLFVSLSIFSVDFWAALIPFGTLLAACTFIFDTSAKALCQGIIFQFVTHPYDSGDLVLIDGSYMFVENIGILGTIFIGADGMKLYAPTVLLQTKIISNVRRSGNMGESLTFNIDFRTNNETILLLRERLSEWVQSQSRDFATGFDMRVSQILDMNQIILVVWLPHKGNWVELGKRFQRKTRFMLALKSILTELNIRYELPAQRITSTSRNSFDISQTLKPQNFNKQEASRSI